MTSAYVHISGPCVHVFDCYVLLLTASDSCDFGFRNYLYEVPAAVTASVDVL